MRIVGVFVCLVLVLNAVSTAPSHQRAKRQEPTQPQGFPQHLNRFNASQQGSDNPTQPQYSQITPKFLPSALNSNHNLNIPTYDQDHETVIQSKNGFLNDEGSLNVSVSTKKTDTESTEVKPSSVPKTVKDSATLQLEKLIADQRVANMKHRERELQQLESAKAQLEQQIENQKELQLKWLEDRMIENSELTEEKSTDGSSNHSYTETKSVMLSKAIQNEDVEIIDKSTETTLTDRKELKTYESEENQEEEQGTKLLLAGSLSDNKNQGREEVSKKESNNAKLFELAMDNEEDGNKDISGETFGDYTTEIGHQFESIGQEETPLFYKEEMKTPAKASNKLDIPQEVSEAVDLVSRYFWLKNTNNLTAPEYVWRAVQELSNYLN